MTKKSKDLFISLLKIVVQELQILSKEKSSSRSANDLLKAVKNYLADCASDGEEQDKGKDKDNNNRLESDPWTKFPLPKEHLSTHQDPPLDKSFFIFSDGACRGNPGPGSYGVLIQNEKGEIEYEGNGFEWTTTNNRMELLGAVEGLRFLRQEYSEFSGNIYLYSDSQYVVKGLNEWLEGWKRRQWKKADGSAPDHLDLWKEFDEYKNFYQKLIAHWVKGHAGHPQNEHCDFLANKILNEQLN